MKTTQETKTGTFVKVAECLYRYDRSGSYFALLKVGGKQRRINLETKDLPHAKRLRDEKRRELERLDISKRNLTLETFLPDYFRKKAPLAFKTRHRIEHVLKNLVDFVDGENLPLGKWKVSRVTKSNLERFINHLTDGLSVSTRKEYVRVLKGFFADLVSDKIIPSSPADDYKITQKAPKIRRETPGIEEVKNIIDAVRNQPFSDTREEAADFLIFLAGAGVGNGEAANLKVQDVDLSAGTIRLHRVKTKTDFEIPVFPAVAEMLERRIKGKQGNEAVFGVKDIKKGLAAACKRLGLPNYSHRAFRRFFITTALDAGANPRAVANWQGHTDIKLVLKVYSEVRGEFSKKESQKVTFTF
jgi:integrase